MTTRARDARPVDTKVSSNYDETAHKEEDTHGHCHL